MIPKYLKLVAYSAMGGYLGVTTYFCLMLIQTWSVVTQDVTGALMMLFCVACIPVGAWLCVYIHRRIRALEATHGK